MPKQKLANDIAQNIWLNAPLQHRNYENAKAFIDPVTKIIQAELDKYILIYKGAGPLFVEALRAHADRMTMGDGSYSEAIWDWAKEVEEQHRGDTRDGCGADPTPNDNGQS